MLNNCTIIGRLSRPIELRRTPSDTPVTSFDLAVERDFKSKSGEKETDWIPCIAWRNDAEYLAKYAQKGDLIGVIGRLTARKWEDKNGQKRTSYEIKAGNVYIVGSNKAKSQSSYAPDDGYDSGESFQPIEDDGELPF